MCNVIRLLRQFLYKHCYAVLCVFLLIVLIIIVQRLFLEYLWEDINNNNKIGISFCKQYKLYLTKIIFNKSTDVIHTNLLRQYLYVNKLVQKIETYNCSVLSDDNLYNVLVKYSGDLNSSDVIMLTRQYPILKYLRVGQTLSWLTISRELQCLVWDNYSQEIRVYHRIAGGFIENIIRISYQFQSGILSCKVLFIGELNNTFVNSVRSLGLEENHIASIINALQYQLNFRKLRQGDRFSILILRVKKSDDCNVQSKLIGARLYTDNKNYYIFSANNGKFYDLEAVRLDGGFIRFPTVKPFRISSSFNLSRLNPVTGQVSPHPGIDFAVPVGTPVLSVGDGEVIVSAYSKVAGNYVVIKHNANYVSRYMHLQKILVKSGQKVRRGDNIALSGNTGRSTGPHLHFEIWYNHRPINPLTSKILNIEKLLGNERIIYLNQVSKIMPQLRFD